jgi:predicted aspartyl protease
MQVLFAMALTVWLLMPAPAAAAEDCRLQIIASLPMQIDSTGRVTVDGEVGGQKTKFIVDTGAGHVAVKRSIAEAAGFKIASIGMSRLRIYGGDRMDEYVIAKDLVLGALKIGQMRMPILPDHRAPGADGLLGADILARFDADFDFAGGKLNLFLPHRCEGRAVYWTDDEALIAKIPFSHNGDGDPHITLPVELDGKPIKAILDTGASETVLPLEWAEDLYGIDRETLAGGGNRFAYPFKMLKLAGVEVANPRIVLHSREASHFDEYRMLLGIDVLRQLHLYISYKEKMLYVTAASVHR